MSNRMEFNQKALEVFNKLRVGHIVKTKSLSNFGSSYWQVLKADSEDLTIWCVEVEHENIDGYDRFTLIPFSMSRECWIDLEDDVNLEETLEINGLEIQFNNEEDEQDNSLENRVKDLENIVFELRQELDMLQYQKEDEEMEELDESESYNEKRDFNYIIDVINERGGNPQGTIWSHSFYNDVNLILCQISIDEFKLISIDSGNRWDTNVFKSCEGSDAFTTNYEPVVKGVLEQGLVFEGYMGNFTIEGV